MIRKSILGIFAHPDDESMGPGATLAKYAAAGHRVAFLTATEGGAGRLHADRPQDDAGRTRLRQIRSEETLAAAAILGIESLGFLGWPDGRLAQMNILEIEATFAAAIRKQRPDVVLTFHGSGISYHPDHRVVTLAVMGAFLGSAHAGWYREPDVSAHPPHTPRKLYAFTPDRESPFWRDWPRDVYASPANEITTVIDTSGTEETKWQAILAHATQQDGPPFRVLYEAGAFRRETFVRVYPPPEAGSPPETDLLAGLV